MSKASPETLARIKAWNLANPEKRKRTALKWYYENREDELRKRHEMQNANPDRIRAWRNNWRAQNAEHTKQQIREWKANHPEYVNEQNNRRRARKLAALCECCTPKDIRPIYVESIRVGGEVDHVVALALGGKHCVNNLQVLTVDQHKIKTRNDKKLIRELRAK